MSKTEWPSRVVPAQLSFLAIYNPALGPTDETFEQQLVYYHSRAASEARAAAKKNARNEAAGDDAHRKEENEKLRQIGLAQGMVDFAKTFANGEPVDSVETEKSRIVLHELERGWWILASIDLTQLPAIPPSETTKKTSDRPTTKTTTEYSAREVSPPALLIQQLVQAHSTFRLHHGPSLDDLFVRFSRENFCRTLDRFWTRFCRGWDVLLHGSPAVDIFNGIKLASGGELGYGVGEEEWGSGEREVIEDLIRRTEGLQDVLVSRFGDPAAPSQATPDSEDDIVPWMGRAAHPGASDGLVFSGMGALERHSIRNVSLWMRQMYSYGEHAYGVRDNPLRERPRKKRRKDKYDEAIAGDIQPHTKLPDVDKGELQQDDHDDTDAARRDEVDYPAGIDLSRPELPSDAVSRDHTATLEETPTPPVDSDKPNIPPPIVTAAERALENATRDADGTIQEQKDGSFEADDENGTTLGIPDQYMKYLTFGLSTLGKANTRRPSMSRQSSASVAHKSASAQPSKERSKGSRTIQADDNPMASLEPIPDGETLRSKIATQIRQENSGHFLIGFRGDLDAPTAEEDLELTDGSLHNDSTKSRIPLRTIQVELTQRQNDEQYEAPRPSVADPDISNPNFMKYQRLRVLVYVHRPFIYCFLFKNRTSSLQYVEFYRSLHQILSPIRTALLSSTDVKKVEQRIESAHATASVASSEAEKANEASKNTLPSKGTSNAPIYDLIYDPRLLTVHTSIPNIPVPGTPAAEGILTALSGSRTPEPLLWNRLEALNVHSQVLNTLHSVQVRRSDIERTSKTSRGWWVVWMKVPPSAPAIVSEADDGEAESQVLTPLDATLLPLKTPTSPPPDMHRIAFLVRRASDAVAAAKPAASSSRAVSSLFGNMSLPGWRSEDPTGGASAGWGPAALAGGIGVDARRYVEGLLSLNR